MHDREEHRCHMGRSRTAASETPAPRVESKALLRGGRKLVIEHNGQEYVLQLTRAGRLILTK